ncbi:hypothetical protein [Thermithiobacillus plumbiphilus]|uniref:Citrate transporter-like domain-containing protein n=1 Tax=Thermithiobacillus plumbiphilus TaxID=1729899 RepID=A0ABU9D722_9PROT
MPSHSVFLIWGFCAAAIVGDIAQWPALQQTATVLLVLALMLDARLWITRGSGKLSLAVGVGALVLGWLAGDPLQALMGLTHYTPVIALLLCVSLIRLPMTASGVDASIKGVLAKVRKSARSGTVTAASVLLAPMLNLGTLAFMSSFLKDNSRPDTTAPVAVTRGIVMSMLWAPSFAPIAMVMAAFPNVTWISTLPIAITLLAASVILGARVRGDIDTGLLPSEIHWHRLWMAASLIAVMLATSILLRVLVDAPLTDAVSASGVVVFFVWLAVAPSKRSEWVTLLSAHTAYMWQAVIAESALFAASGILAEVLRQPHWASMLQYWLSFANQPTWGAMTTLVLGIPALATIGLHPIVPFSILVHTVTPQGLGVTPPVLYMTWVIIWVLSLLVSPVSALNLTASAAFGVSSWRLGFQTNWCYGLALGVAAVFILHLWS